MGKPHKDMVLALKAQITQACAGQSSDSVGQQLGLLPKALADDSGMPRKGSKVDMRKGPR